MLPGSSGSKCTVVRAPSSLFKAFCASSSSLRRYSFDQGAEAARLEGAVQQVLADGVRTADLMGPEGGTPVSTSGMGDAILAALDASL